MYGKGNSLLQHAADFLNGIATVVHHGAVVFVACMLLANVVSPS